MKIPASLRSDRIHIASELTIHIAGIRTLEGNLEGDDVDRDVIVFLPPGYATQKSRHYPVVYALHGYSIGAEQWSHEIHVPQTIEAAFAQEAQEMIVVLPDAKTVHNGSMYSSSVTTGDFEQFIGFWRDFSAGASYATSGRIRDRRSSKPALPYICRLTVFSRLM